MESLYSAWILSLSLRVAGSPWRRDVVHWGTEQAQTMIYDILRRDMRKSSTELISSAAWN